MLHEEYVEVSVALSKKRSNISWLVVSWNKRDLVLKDVLRNVPIIQERKFSTATQTDSIKESSISETGRLLKVLEICFQFLVNYHLILSCWKLFQKFQNNAPISICLEMWAIFFKYMFKPAKVSYILHSPVFFKAQNHNYSSGKENWSW